MMELMEPDCGRRAALKFRCFQIAAVVVLLISSCATPSKAQQAASSGFDPRQAEHRFDTRDPEQQRNTSKPLPRLPGMRQQTNTYDRKPSFALHGISVVGASAIPGETIAQTYASYLGKRVSQADLADIAQSITELYRASGYHLSRAIIAPQDVKGGRITITVIEGSVAELVIKGD